MNSRIEVSGFHARVSLGVSDEERAFPQEVEFGLKITFARIPDGARTDRIGDTLCYAELCDILEKIAHARSYHLIENLGLTAYEAIKKHAGSAAVEVTVHKLRPPIAQLRQGVRFVCGDPIA
jgi:dihydroneopterin aldolase